MDPVRLVHKWTLMRLTTKLAVMPSSEDRKFRDLEKKYGLDWVIVVVELYMEMVGNVKGSHGTESRFTHRLQEEAIKLQNEPINSRLDTQPTWDGETLAVE